MSKKININLTELAGGAAQERFDQALVEVVKNILDVNTDAKKARKVTLTVSIKPNEQRELGDVVVEVKTALAPNVGVPTTIMMGRDSDTGKIQAAELKSNAPGQTFFDPEDSKLKTDVGEPVEEIEASAEQSAPDIIDLQQHKNQG